MVEQNKCPLKEFCINKDSDKCDFKYIGKHKNHISCEEFKKLNKGR